MQDNISIAVTGQTIAKDLHDLWTSSRARYLGWCLTAVGVFYAYLAFAEFVNEGFCEQTAFTIIPHSVTAVLTFFAPIYIPRTRARLMIRHSPLLQESRQYVLSSRGIHILSDLATCDYQWGAFYKISESRKSFLFFQSLLYAIVIPKRFLATAEDVTTVRKLVSAHFKGKHRLLS